MIKFFLQFFRHARPFPAVCKDTSYGLTAETQRKLLRVAINATTRGQ